MRPTGHSFPSSLRPTYPIWQAVGPKTVDRDHSYTASMILSPDPLSLAWRGWVGPLTSGVLVVTHFPLYTVANTTTWYNYDDDYGEYQGNSSTLL